MLILATNGGLGGLGFLLPMIIIFGIFYLLIIAPQRRKEKEKRQKLSLVKKNDRVITIGGIYGVATRVTDKDAVIRIDDNVKIKITKTSILEILPDEEKKEEN